MRHTLKRMFCVLLLMSLSFAATDTTSQKLTSALCDVKKTLDSVLPVVAFVLFVLAGTAYAVGQFFGAEMRARANTWAMSCVTGAIIGLLIVQFAGMIIKNLTGYETTTLCL